MQQNKSNKLFSENKFTLFYSQLIPLLPEVFEITQDAGGLIPEEIAKVCEQKLKDGKPLPKVSQKYYGKCFFFNIARNNKEIIICFCPIIFIREKYFI